MNSVDNKIGVLGPAALAAAVPLFFGLTLNFNGLMVAEPSFFRLSVIAGIQIFFIAATASSRDLSLLQILKPHYNFMLALLVLIAISKTYFFPDYIVFNLLRTASWVVHVVFGLCLYLYLKQYSDGSILTALIVAVVGGAVGYAGLLTFEFLAYGPPAGDKCTVVLPGFPNIRFGGAFMTVAAIFCGAVASVRKRKHEALLCIVAAVFLWALLGFTGTRAAIASAIGAILVAGLLNFKMSLLRPIVMVLISALLGLFISYLLPASNCGGFDLFGRIGTKLSDGNMASGRPELWLITVDFIKEYPLFGRGEVPLFSLAPDRIRTSQSHNMFLQAVLTWGIIGGGLFWLLLSRFLWVLGNAQGRNSALTPIYMALVGGVTYSMLDATPLHYDYAIFVMTILACGGGAIAFSKPKPHT